jgi:hypothetical protein
MHSKAQSYFSDALAYTGFAIASSTIAYSQRRDLWASAFNAATDMSSAPEQLRRYAEDRGAKLFRVDLEGVGMGIPVLAMSHSKLASRIEEVTGRSATNLRPLMPEATPEPAAPVMVDGEQIPDWPCARRTEMLRKAGLPDSYKAPDYMGSKT